jgi:signal transduction histidine kinase/CheY-like chemotaxis protein
VPDRSSAAARPRPTLRFLAGIALGALADVGRAGARALILSGRRWAAETRAAAREQLFGTSAALEVSEAALAGETLHDLGSRIARLALALSGATEAVVFARSAGALLPVSCDEVDPALRELALRADAGASSGAGPSASSNASAGREKAGAGEPASEHAVAMPLVAGLKPAGVLCLRLRPQARLRHRRLAPLLRRAGAALASAERQASKDRFLSFAAHELKTPLTSIKGYAYSLARRTEHGEPADPRAIEVLERQAERLHGLLEEMLEVSRLETGRFVLHQEPCELGELLDSALRALRRLGSDGVEVIGERVPLPLFADRDRLERALVALTLRARSLGRVRASTERSSERAVLRIAWEGPALPAVARAQAFGPRWETPTPERLGLGMALAVAERVASLHGGVLRCEPDAFVLEVPLRETRAEPPGASGARRALVVDDDEAIAGMLAELLAEHGFAADSATGGRAALLKMQAEPPDLLVLDLRMPEMDGRALLAEVRRSGFAPRVVLLSADGDVARAAKELGADAFVEKPFAPEGLLAAIRRAIPGPGPASKGQPGSDENGESP